jgi:hypothetical protein
MELYLSLTVTQLMPLMKQNWLPSGLTKPGEVDEILTLYQLKSPSLESRAKLKSPSFILHFSPISCK